MPKIFIISISLFCILIFGNFAILPNYRALGIKNIELNEKRAELASKEQYFEQIKSLINDLDEYSDQLEKVWFAVPDNPDFVPFFGFLQKTCAENGLILGKINSFESLASKKANRVEKSIVHFEAIGNFNSLLNFLKALEKSARIIEIVGIDFSTPKQDEAFIFKIEAKIHSS